MATGIGVCGVPGTLTGKGVVEPIEVGTLVHEAARLGLAQEF